MAMPALGDRDRRALQRGAAVVAVALLYTLGIRPSRERRAQLLEQLEAERAVLAREETVAAAAGRMARDTTAPSSRALFGGADAVIASASLADYVATTAEAQDLWVNQTVTRAPSLATGARPAPPPLEVTMRAEGDLSGLVRLLRALEAGRMLVQVAELDVKASGADETSAPLGITATVRSVAAPAGSPP